MFLCLLQLKNVDFEGLFGNIGGVISLSQRLLKTLQDTDSIGERPHPPPTPLLPLLSNQVPPVWWLNFLVTSQHIVNLFFTLILYCLKTSYCSNSAVLQLPGCGLEGEILKPLAAIAF